MIIKPPSTPMSIQLAAIALVAVAGLVTFTTATVADEEGRKREGDAPREGDSDRSERSPGEESQRREGERPTSRESARDGERSTRESEDGRPAEANGPLRITVRRDGVILGEKMVPLVDFRRELEGTTTKSAVLAADRGVPYQTVETVVTALRSAGIQEIAFGTAGGESGNVREGLRDGEGNPKAGPRDGDVPRSGPREGDAPRSENREGEGDRPASSRDGEISGVDERKLQQATRIYRAYDKDGDAAVTFEERLAMKNGEMTADRKATEKGWFDQSDASRDGKITLGEWIDWQANRGRDQG